MKQDSGQYVFVTICNSGCNFYAIYNPIYFAFLLSFASGHDFLTERIVVKILNPKMEMLLYSLYIPYRPFIDGFRCGASIICCAILKKRICKIHSNCGHYLYVAKSGGFALE